MADIEIVTLDIVDIGDKTAKQFKHRPITSFRRETHQSRMKEEENGLRIGLLTCIMLFRSLIRKPCRFLGNQIAWICTMRDLGRFINK